MRAVLLATVVAIAVLVPAELASACSCAPLTPEAKLRGSKAGVAGRVVGKKLVDDKAGPEVFRYRVRVRTALKRKLGRFVSIRADASDATCGFRWRKGQVVGAFLTGRPGKWRTNLCLLERPKAIRRLAASRRSEAAGGERRRDAPAAEQRVGREPCRARAR